jgi:hypothetical protein
MNRSQMGSFQCTRNPINQDLLLLVTGTTRYKAILA